MKKIVRILASVLTFAFLASPLVYSQERSNKKARPSPNAAVSQTIGTSIVSVTYGRPGLKGRPLESLAPAGKVWRLGANESTAITFSTDVMVGDKAVSAGTYSVYAIPGKDQWTIIINSKLSWGTRYEEAMDVARVTAKATTGSNAEWFTISFDSLSNESSDLVLHWGTAVVTVPISVGG